MAESQKGTSSGNRKEKNSFLDDDIGNDFLTSWKPMSATKGDAMDFGFDTVSSGKNKTYNFEKLDMDFSLDGEFDKLSSFKVDMSDFDFSSPSKKVAKAKENSADESSSGKPHRKNNQFNFFDFNEMDNFDFESSLVVGKSSVKNKDGKLDISSDKTEQRSSKLQLSHDAGNLNDTVAVKLPGSKGTVTPDVEAILSGKGHLFDKGKDCEKGVSAGALILPRSVRSSPEKVRTDGAETTDRHDHLSEKEIAMDVYSQHEKVESPGTSVAGVDSKRHASSDIETRNSCQGTEVDSTLGQKDHVNAEATGISSYNETIPLKNPYQLDTNSGSTNGWKNESGTDVPSETVNGHESAVGDLEPTESSISSLSRKSSSDINVKEKNRNQTCTMELRSAIQHRTVVNSNEAQTGVKSGANLVSVAREMLEGDVLLVGGENNVKHVSNHRECFTSDVLPNDCKLAGTSQLYDEEVTEKKKALVSTGDKDVGNQTPTGFQVSSFSLSEKQQLKSSSPTSVNPKCLLSRVESTRDTKIKSVEGNKVSVVRSPKKLTSLSLLTTSKTKGAAEKVSDSTSQRHTSSLQNPRHEMKVLYISTSESAHPLESSKKKSPPNFSLKRKSYELLDSDLACLKPLKRLSLQEKRKFQGPPRQGVEDKSSRVEENIEPVSFLPKASNIRDFEEPVTSVDVKESLKRVDGEKETQKENHSQNNLNSIPVSVVHSPRETNVMDLELSLTIENDGSVERAEVYAKDLEDICNMLRKKQEEAKEILVRALVNNNNLLMLNHPIYEEKISKVQKFAVELMSKELKT